MKKKIFTDGRALKLALFLGNLAGGLIYACNDPRSQKWINATIPEFAHGHTPSSILASVAMVLGFVAFPAIVSAVAIRYSFLWATVAPIITAAWMGANGWRDFGHLGLAAIAIFLSAGPVSAARYAADNPIRLANPKFQPLHRLFRVVMPLLFVTIFGTVIYSYYEDATYEPTTGLRHYQSLSFVATISAADVRNGSFGAIAPNQVFTVKALRPGSLRIEENASSKIASRQSPLLPFSQFVSNGKKQCELSPRARVYILGPSKAFLDKVDSKAGLPEAIMSNVVFAQGSLPGWHHDGADQKIGEINCSVYTRRHTENRHAYLERLFLGTERNVPRRISQFESDANGQWAEIRRIDYTQYTLDPKLNSSVFNVSSPSGAKQGQMPVELSLPSSQLPATSIGNCRVPDMLGWRKEITVKPASATQGPYRSVEYTREIDGLYVSFKVSAETLRKSMTPASLASDIQAKDKLLRGTFNWETTTVLASQPASFRGRSAYRWHGNYVWDSHGHADVPTASTDYQATILLSGNTKYVFGRSVSNDTVQTKTTPAIEKSWSAFVDRVNSP